MCKLFQKKILIVFILLIIFVNNAFSQLLFDEKNNFSIMLPAGFYIVEQDNNSGYYLCNDGIPVEAIVRVYDEGKYSSTQEALQSSISKINGKCECENFKWRNTQCSLGNFEFDYNQTPCTGWVCAIQLPKTQNILCVLSYTAQESDTIFIQCILSILDSINIDRGSYFEAGLVTSYTFPKSNDITQSISFENKEYQVIFDSSDEEASEYLVEREYSILELYADTDLWLQAWQRYYQLIFRDSYSRMKRACFSFTSLLAENMSNGNPSDLEIAEKLLAFTQNMPYGTISERTNFTNICSTFLGKSSDCDSRSILLAILFKQLNIKSTLFVSTEYKHAIVGAVIDKAGAKIQINETEYLLGETTAHVAFGLIAQNMNDTKKWINVPLPE